MVDHTPGQRVVGEFQYVGARPIDAQAVTHRVGKKCEAAADQQGFEAGRLASTHQLRRAGVELQTLMQHQLHLVHRNAAQQLHALAQTFFVVGNLATHRRLGNRCHFGLAPGCVGHLVDALDVDQRGVHVKGDQLEVRQA